MLRKVSLSRQIASSPLLVIMVLSKLFANSTDVEPSEERESRDKLSCLVTDVVVF